MAIATARLIGRRPRRKSLWSSTESFFTEAGLFIFGAAGAYSVNLVGALPFCEVLLFPMLPVLFLVQGKRAFRREYLLFYVVTGAWLLGTVIADTYNNIGGYNWIKGLARVAFFALDFMALAILINDKTRRLIIFALSIAAIMLAGSWQFKSDFNIQWKFGLAQSTGTVALLISSYYYSRRRYWVCFLISLILGGLSLAYGFRSQLAIVFVSAALILPLSNQARQRHGDRRGGQDTFRILILLVLAGGAAYAANAAIKYAAERGFFDESTRAKFETQSKGDYGVLVGGRPETLVAIQAIIDAPILGHGSFAYGEKYVELKQDIMYKHGYTESDSPEVLDYPTIPTHSHLTLAWVEGGILGGICWIYILVLTIRGILRLSALRPNLSPLYCYLLVSFLWDILYSPFGSVNRIIAAYYILLTYHLLKTPAREALIVHRQKVMYNHGGRGLRLAKRTAY